MEEIWKDIKGLENQYQVSNLGRVRKIKYCSLSTDTNGYQRTSINKKTVKIHRLVAEAFLENPNNLPQINHNVVTNLEYCDSKYNINYGNRIEKCKKTFKENFERDFEFRTKKQQLAIMNGKKACKKVIQYDTDMAFVAEYSSLKECSKINNIDYKHLHKSIKDGKLCKGFYFFIKN